MMEVSFELEGEAEHVAEVVIEAVEAQNGEEVDIDAEARKVFLQHLVNQYAKTVE